jgi:hypothetical protein
MNKMYDIMTAPQMHLAPDKRAEADYLRASFDYAQWNPSGPDSAANSAARGQAIASLTSYHDANKNKPDSARYVLESAYRVAKMKQASGDPAFKTWFKTTIADWEFFKSHPASVATPDGKGGTINATDAPFSDYGGEADFFALDEQVRDQFDYDTGHHRYKGNAVDVKDAVDKDLGIAEKTWRPPLELVATKYGSFEWAAAATARVGSLYDSIRTGLDLVVPQYFTPKQKAQLDKLQKIVDQLSAAGQQDQADKVQAQLDKLNDDVRGAWRSTKDQYLELCTQKMVSRYVTAAMVARKYNVRDATVQKAVTRLAFFTDYLGDDKMKAYVEQTPDPNSQGTNLVYTPGMFLQWRSGVDATPPADGQPAPLPVAP